MEKGEVRAGSGGEGATGREGGRLGCRGAFTRRRSCGCKNKVNARVDEDGGTDTNVYAPHSLETDRGSWRRMWIERVEGG